MPRLHLCAILQQNPHRILKLQEPPLFSLPADKQNWTWNVSWWSDPVFFGQYPKEGLVKYEKYLPKITDEDMKLISQPIDMYGQNIYNGQCVRMGKDGKPEFVKRYEGFPKTAIDWAGNTGMPQLGTALPLRKIPNTDLHYRKRTVLP